MRIGSGKSWAVKAREWFQPLRAFARYFSGKACGT